MSDTFIDSLSLNPADYNTQKTSGKSGARFFLTRFIKSILKDEKRNLLKVLSRLTSYLETHANNTLIVPVFALVKVFNILNLIRRSKLDGLNLQSTSLSIHPSSLRLIYSQILVILPSQMSMSYMI